jgi:hypothetical protein
LYKKGVHFFSQIDLEIADYRLSELQIDTFQIGAGYSIKITTFYGGRFLSFPSWPAAAVSTH